MYFKRIDMHGFKSFAEPVSIEFRGGITCIVGPNGSGKSNISDAIRWVLGEQSPKMLRGGKMEEVIFAGTANRKSRGMAEVTLVIDNAKGILPIDYAEVEITRKMYRSGESEYFLNKNQCRLRDIRELIMDTGIGVDGYSLIGQGKIADIVSNKTESRREIFEEAAGIVKYRTKKAESERKLGTAQGNLERVEDIVSEIESRIGKLKTDSEKATEYLMLKERYQEMEINITLKNIEGVELKNEYIKDDLTETNNQIDQCKEEKSEVDALIVEARVRNEELERLSNQGKDRLLASVEEINGLVNQGQLNKEKLLTIEKDKVRLGDEITTIEGKLAKEQNNADELFQNKIKIDEKLEIQQADLNSKIKEYAEITGNISAEAQKIDNQKNKIYEMQRSISEKSSQIESMFHLQGSLDRRRQQILSEKATSDHDNQGILEKQEDARTKKQSISQKLEQLAKQEETERASYNQAVLKERDLRKELEELRVTIGQVSTRKKMIEEMESNYEGYNHAVKFIMKSNLLGINGVVAELVKVPSGFETAIETALGAAMQNIVCEDNESAQAAIRALKTNKAGRLTFLPLQSVKAASPNYDNMMKDKEGFKGFGVQCISFDPKYQSIMNYLLGRVIIVDKLENAVKLSKNATGGLRFVTLEGEVINSGGAITGGTFRNNTANLLERKTEINKLAERLAKMEDTQAEGAKEIEALRTLIHHKLETIETLNKSHRDAEMQLLSKENELYMLAGQITDVQASEAKWQNELDDIIGEGEFSETRIAELRNFIAQDEVELETLTKHTEDDILAYEEKKMDLSKINDEITKARIAAGAAESEKDNVDQILDRIERYIGELTDEIEAKKLLLSELQFQKEGLVSGDTNLEATVKSKEEDKAALEQYLNELQEEKTRVVKNLNEITQKKESMDEILSGFQAQKYELEIKQAKNETQLDHYKNKLWDEFEISYIQAIEFKKKEFNMGVAVKESKEIKTRMKSLGEVNIGAIKEYEAVSERYEFLTVQRDDLLEAMNALKEIILDMDKTIRANFKESFDKIVENFEESFQQLFGGGTAELRLEDENRPLECGIEIIVQPPGKKLQNINLMSGGEKTMTAIALMFAVLKTKPTPFCILDEVEAALDDSNIDRFARYLTNFKEIQFALVTHQKATMEYADVLYGVTMPEQGISKIISLKFGEEFEL